LREYYLAGGRPATGTEALGDHLQRLSAELETMRRVVRTTLRENKQLRRLISAPRRSAAERRTAERSALRPDGTYDLTVVERAE
jgi:hypothetical protein